MKIKAAEEIGIKAQHIRYPDTLSETQVCLAFYLLFIIAG